MIFTDLDFATQNLFRQPRIRVTKKVYCSLFDYRLNYKLW